MTIPRAAKRPLQLPDSPPQASTTDLPLTPAGVFRPESPPRERYYIGRVSNPSATARYILGATYCRDGVQRLLYAGRKWWVWRGEPPAWQLMDVEELEATLYRALRDNRWPATPSHVAKLVSVAKLELFYPPTEMRCAA